MRNNNKKDYSNKGYLAFHSKQITELINNSKINIAKKKVQDLIEQYPFDTELKVQLSRIHIIEKEYEEALYVLEQLDEEIVFLKLAALYIKLKQEDKLFYLYQKYFKEDSKYSNEYENNRKYRLLSVYLNKKYNPNYKLDTQNLLYYEKQIYSYSKELAIRHIKNNHCLSKEHDKGIFSEDINIEELYNKVNSYISNNPNEGYLVQTMTDAIYFYYPGIGKTQDSGLYDCLCVFLNSGTKEILTMFPATKRKNIEYLYFEKESTTKKRIRTPKSGLERFQSRYNK